MRKTVKTKLNPEWYSIRSLLGSCNWGMFFCLIGAREAGKSFALTEFFVRQFIKYGRPFYWLRLTESSAKKLLQNNAEKLIDAEIRRRYNINDLVTNGSSVYMVLRRDEHGKIREKKLMAKVLAVNTFYNEKGQAHFDSEFLNDPKMYYNIAMDECSPEKDERRTFDVLYATVNQLENLVRSTKTRLRVFFVCNLLEEASDILSAFNFIPEEYGRYYLKSKRCVIDYIAPSEKYLKRRQGTIADILMPEASTFSNRVEIDSSLVYKGRLIKPSMLIKFKKSKDCWFTVWDSGVVRKYNGEKCPVIAMRPYLDELFNTEARDNIISLFDNRSFKYANLITFKLFQKNVELLKPRK